LRVHNDVFLFLFFVLLDGVCSSALTIPAVILKQPILLSLRGDAFLEYQRIVFEARDHPSSMLAKASASSDFSDGRAQFYSGGSYITAFGAGNANAL
jgi:hypothetical protein